MCFINLVDYSYLEHNEPISHLKTVISRMYSFPKLAEFSKGNSVLEAAASNIGDCLCRATCVSSTHLNRPT
jgi:hypothetical protein